MIELVDARVPLSSRNPDIDELGKGKARLILLNKADLAEDRWNNEWKAYFESKGYSCVKVNSKKGGGLKSIQAVIPVSYTHLDVYKRQDIHSKHTTHIDRNIRQHQFHELKFLRGYECIQLSHRKDRSFFHSTLPEDKVLLCICGDKRRYPRIRSDV